MSHRLSGVLPLLLVILVLSIHTTMASRLLAETETGRANLKVARIPRVLHPGELKGDVDIWDMLGLEECEDGNEECLKRRELSQAHLDYIYTQRHHNP